MGGATKGAVVTVMMMMMMVVVVVVVVMVAVMAMVVEVLMTMTNSRPFHRLGQCLAPASSPTAPPLLSLPAPKSRPIGEEARQSPGNRQACDRRSLTCLRLHIRGRPTLSIALVFVPPPPHLPLLVLVLALLLLPLRFPAGLPPTGPPRTAKLHLRRGPCHHGWLPRPRR